ncbi:lamin tail domain-containing protein [Micromonospora sp. IBHARD004]|uniref:lamin tail domain-containing protein n=1 Tax=Micromonospora sp. IBHARD004 TaxID=3457764 RepID=UPI0040597421
MRLTAVELLPEDPYPGGQLVVLVNGSGGPVDLTCWTVRSTVTGKSARIMTGHALPPGGYLRLLPESVLFDSADTLSLLDRSGRLVDRTPSLTDRARDDQVWFRQRNGSWTFGRGFRLPDRVDDGRLAVGINTC